MAQTSFLLQVNTSELSDHLSTYSGQSVESCAVLCLKKWLCRAFSYSTGEEVCELFSKEAVSYAKNNSNPKDAIKVYNSKWNCKLLCNITNQIFHAGWFKYEYKPGC